MHVAGTMQRQLPTLSSVPSELASLHSALPAAYLKRVAIHLVLILLFYHHKVLLVWTLPAIIKYLSRSFKSNSSFLKLSPYLPAKLWLYSTSWLKPIHRQHLTFHLDRLIRLILNLHLLINS